jgi:hypothetical protein
MPIFPFKVVFVNLNHLLFYQAYFALLPNALFVKITDVCPKFVADMHTKTFKLELVYLALKAGVFEGTATPGRQSLSMQS